MDSRETWRWLPWDSEFFGLRIARIESAPLSEERIREFAVVAQSERIDCFYAFLEATDIAGIRLAEAAGFLHTDVRVVLDRSIEKDGLVADSDQGLVDEARPEDVPRLSSIASQSHRSSRFYADSHFPAERCDAFYAEWIRTSCDEYADQVFVARVAGEPAGYLTCHLDPERWGRIGLVAVSEDARGNALGPSLVDRSLRWFAGKGCNRVSVTTQGRNVHAQRLYQSAGFRTREVGHWYHWWPGESVRIAEPQR